MASTALRQTTSSVNTSLGGMTGGSQAYAGDRLWELLAGGTTAPAGLRLRYSDDDGATWTDLMQIDATTSNRVGTLCAYQSGGVWRVEGAVAAGNSNSQSLIAFYLDDNVATGTPLSGDVAITTVDAGGSGLGVQYPYIFRTETASNKRTWIVAMKSTTTTMRETRVYHRLDGGSWLTTNFTNLGGAQKNLAQHGGVGVGWNIGGNDRATIVFKDTVASPSRWAAVTFDPAAATPTPGSVSAPWAGGSHDHGANGQHVAIAAKDDYLVVAMYGHTTTAVQLRKTVDGSTWTTPSGWAIGTGSQPALARIGENFALAMSPSASLVLVGALALRTIDAATDAISASTALSDTNGASPTFAVHEADERLVAHYVAGAASPWTFRQEVITGLDFGGVPADVDAPGAPTALVATSASSGRVDLSFLMPADVDAAAYTVRRAVGTVPPATSVAGTEVVPWTAAAPSEAVEVTDLGLTDGTRYAYSVFARDEVPNVSAPASAEAVPLAPLTLVSPIGAATVADSPYLVWDTSAANVESGRDAHFRVEISQPGGDIDTATASSSAVDPSAFEWDDGGVWTALPVGGLAAAEVGAQVRYLASGVTAAGEYVWRVRVEHGA